jgi:hypothetical protein
MHAKTKKYVGFIGGVKTSNTTRKNRKLKLFQLSRPASFSRHHKNASHDN